MQEGTVGRRYARALLSSLDKESEGKLTQLEGELSAVAALLDRRQGHHDFRQAMLNPIFNVDQRKAVLKAIGDALKLDATTTRFLTLLVDKERIPQLQAIAAAFRDEVDHRVGRVRATILTAKALSPSALADIVRGLEQRTGKKVVPDVAVDASVIAGVRAKIGGTVFDATVRARLDRLRAEFQVQ